LRARAEVVAVVLVVAAVFVVAGGGGAVVDVVVAAGGVVAGKVGDAVGVDSVEADFEPPQFASRRAPRRTASPLTFAG
jgi:hypothetical protein